MTREEKTQEIDALCLSWAGLLQGLEDKGLSTEVLLPALFTVYATYYAQRVETLDGLDKELKVMKQHIIRCFNDVQQIRSEEATKQ